MSNVQAYGQCHALFSLAYQAMLQGYLLDSTKVPQILHTVVVPLTYIRM